jgi:hypothetical protein
MSPIAGVVGGLGCTGRVVEHSIRGHLSPKVRTAPDRAISRRNKLVGRIVSADPTVGITKRPRAVWNAQKTNCETWTRHTCFCHVLLEIGWCRLAYELGLDGRGYGALSLLGLFDTRVVPFRLRPRMEWSPYRSRIGSAAVAGSARAKCGGAPFLFLQLKEPLKRMEPV